jgi:transcriptional regulator with XRE-family HTH domain
MHSAWHRKRSKKAFMDLEIGSVAYVKSLLRQLGLKPSALAKKAGIATTTLTRALNDPNHKFTLSTTTLNKIASATGISPAPFLKARDQVQLTAASNHPAEAFDTSLWKDRKSPIDRETPFSTMTVVIGEIAPGEWQDPALLAATHLPLFLALVGLKPKDTFACIAKGSGAYPVASDGEFLVCRRLLEHERELNSEFGLFNGETVIVETRSKENFTVELTARVIQSRGDYFELIQFDPEDKKKPRSVLKIKSLKEQKDFRILGVVKFVARYPRQMFPDERSF